MTVSDDSMRNTWIKHLEVVQKNIDLYISSNYRADYVKHDLNIEEELFEEDDFGATTSVVCAPSYDLLKDSRCFQAAEEGFPLSDNLAIDDFLRQQGETFSHMLLRLIDERNLRDSEVYKNANIDRRLFSKIRGDGEYIPSKKTVICFCMALQLELAEARKLLEAAGYALSASSKFDLIIMYLLKNREYNVVFANIVLESYGESTLTR